MNNRCRPNVDTGPENNVVDTSPVDVLATYSLESWLTEGPIGLLIKVIKHGFLCFFMLPMVRVSLKIKIY